MWDGLATCPSVPPSPTVLLAMYAGVPVNSREVSQLEFSDWLRIHDWPKQWTEMKFANGSATEVKRISVFNTWDGYGIKAVPHVLRADFYGEDLDGYTPDWTRVSYQIFRFKQLGPNKSPLREVLDMLAKLSL